MDKVKKAIGAFLFLLPLILFFVFLRLTNREVFYIALTCFAFFWFGVLVMTVGSKLMGIDT